MKPIKRKKLILSLIQDDLINTKLVGSLNNLGLMADCYRLHAGATAMSLLHINTSPHNWEVIHNGYLDLTVKVLLFDLQESPHLLQQLTREIYTYLAAHQPPNPPA